MPVSDADVQVLFYACLSWGQRRGLLIGTLNSHPMSLKYLFPALMHFYIGKLLIHEMDNVLTMRALTFG